MDAVSADRRTVTTMVLRVAVPLWLERLRGMNMAARRLQTLDWTTGSEATFRRYADDLDPGSDRAPMAYRSISRTLAGLSILGGGATFAGWLWCGTHDPEGHVRKSWEFVCPECVADRLTDDPAPGTWQSVLADERRRFLIAVHRDGRFA